MDSRRKMGIECLNTESHFYLLKPGIVLKLITSLVRKLKRLKLHVLKITRLDGCVYVLIGCVCFNTSKITISSLLKPILRICPVI